MLFFLGKYHRNSHTFFADYGFPCIPYITNTFTQIIRSKQNEAKKKLKYDWKTGMLRII